MRTLCAARLTFLSALVVALSGCPGPVDCTDGSCDAGTGGSGGGRAVGGGVGGGIQTGGGQGGGSAGGGATGGTGGGASDAGLEDAGFPDGGEADAGPSDSGVADAGTVDAGFTDAGVRDAGAPDSGVFDAGATDAGAPDAGAVDAGPVDAGPPPLSITYAGVLLCQRGLPCTSVTPTFTGGRPTAWSITSPTLPSGLAIDAMTGVVSGTATTLLPANTNFTVVAANAAGQVQGIFVLAVTLQNPTVTYTPTAFTCTRGMACAIPAPTLGGDPITPPMTIAPALPAGLTFSGTDGSVSGTPTVGLTTRTFTISAGNGAGVGTATITLTVIDFPPSGLTYNPSTVVCALNGNCSVPAPTSDGGVPTSFAAMPALPTGLTFNTTSGAITGRATAASAAQPYTITATNSGGTAQTTLTLSVTDLPPASVTYANTTCVVGTPCSVTPALLGGVPTSFSSSPPLPAWATLNQSTGAITGTPTAKAPPTSYTLTASNGMGMASGTLRLFVQPPLTTLPLVTGTTTVTQFKGIGIDPNDGGTLYAVTYRNEVVRSVNAGATWSQVCIARGSVGLFGGNVLVSPQGVAFVADSATVDRIESPDAGACTPLSRSVANNNEFNQYFAFAPNGRITSTNSSNMATSDDNGATWQTVAGSRGAAYSSSATDPFDPARVLRILFNDGVYQGASTLLVAGDQGAGFEPLLFDPVHPGVVIGGNSGSYSFDGGASWLSDSDHKAKAIDATGAGYRLEALAATTVLRTTPDLSVASPVWMTTATINEPLGLGTDTVKVSGSTVIAHVNSKVFVSTDRGVTFSPELSLSLPILPTPPTSVAAVGATIYQTAINGVARSLDDGQTWAYRQLTPPPDAETSANGLLEVAPSDPLRAYLRAERFSGTYGASIWATANGFDSVVATKRAQGDYGGWYCWASLMAIDPFDATRARILGCANFATTTSGGAMWTMTATSSAPDGWGIWYPSRTGALSPFPMDPRVFYVLRASATTQGTLRTFDTAGGSSAHVDITSALPFADPAELQVVGTAMAPVLRVISATGKVATSTDGVTFTAVNSVGGLPSAAGRIVRSASGNPAFMVTANLTQSPVSAALSMDSGATWSTIQGVCGQVRDIAITPTKIIFTCTGAPAQVLTF